jgi:hypothetical protein
MKRFNRRLRSKAGCATIAVLLILTLGVAYLGDRMGWWTIIPRPGTVQESFPPPTNAQTCLPTASTTDGKFIVLPGADIARFNGAPVVIWIGVPSQYTQFTVKIFDGDSMMDEKGNLSRRGGHWDEIPAESVYSIYSDPLKNGSTSIKIGEWRGNQLKMPDNGWYEIQLPVSSDAKAPSGHYFYRLEARLENPTNGMNTFKLCSDAYLTTGASDTMFSEKYNAQIGLVGMYSNSVDWKIIYPKFASLDNPGPSNYTGRWLFTFPIDSTQDYFEFWNGDFDRGASEADFDTDDPNTPPEKPLWTNLTPKLYPSVRPEGGELPQGNPAENFIIAPLLVREPAVSIEIRGPDGQVLLQDNNPSGTEEWEKFSITSNPAKYPEVDSVLPAPLQPGYYTLEINGLDLHNIIWLHLPICDLAAGCGPGVTAGVCPRTIGYWKDNISEVLINNSTDGAQETPESLDLALRFIAAASPLYRNGINISQPSAIADPGMRLTNQEAFDILMRGANQAPYPGDPETILARALQQNLAAWLSLGSGKIGANTFVQLSRDGSTIIFAGTVWDALQEAQTILLNPESTNQELEQAKDIGDLINNGLLGEDAADSVCSDYTMQIPPERQKPRDKLDKPENPKDEVPVTPVGVSPENIQAACTTGNTYQIENPTGTDQSFSSTACPRVLSRVCRVCRWRSRLILILKPSP